MLIAFSGTDGAGKSTQIELLSATFINRDKAVKRLWARGGYTPGFEALKKLLRIILKKKVPRSGHSSIRTQSFRNPLVAKLWLWLAILDLIFFWCLYARTLSFSGRYVIFDRYVDDTRIDFNLNFPNVNIEKLFLWRLLELLAPSPDVSFLLWVPVDVSLLRSAQKSEPFPDDEETLLYRLDSYLDEEKFSSEKYMKLDGTLPINDMSQLIIQECKNRGVI